MAGDIEAELKFALTRADIAVLKAARDLDDLTVGKPETEILVSTYFDAADQRLRRAGISLRVRRSGERVEQTVKIAAAGTGTGGPIGALALRREATVAIAGEAPDLPAFADEGLIAGLREVLAGADLRALFTIRVTRQTRLLVDRAGNEIEFALDEGEIVAGERRAEICEAELELKSGEPRALFQVATAAMAPVPVRFSAVAKSELGYRLVDGAAAEPPAPVKAAEADLSADATVEMALQAVLRSCFAQIAANLPAVVDGTDPEGPHQLRVGLRRLRSALSAFGKVVDRTSAARLTAETRWLAGIVGDLRDLDVLVEEIVAPCADRVDVSGLLDLLRARRAAVRERLVAALSGPRTGAFLIGLAAYVEGRGWLSFTDIEQTTELAGPIPAFAERAVHRQWAKVARMGRDAGQLSGEERHDLRKAFKKLRYALDFFGGLMDGRERRKLMRDVKAAQEVLGYLNDVLMAQAMMTAVSEAPEYAAADPAARSAIDRALGFCLGWHEARAEKVWDDARDLVSLDEKEF